MTTPISFQMEMSADARENSTHEPYGEFQTIFAIYDDANDGVTVGYNTTAGAKVLAENSAPSWDGANLPVYFSDSDSVGADNISVTESQMAGMLRTNSISIDGFSMFWRFPVLYPPRFANRPYDSDFTLVNFSSAAPGGSAIISEVYPSPPRFRLCSLRRRSSELSVGANAQRKLLLERRRHALILVHAAQRVHSHQGRTS